MYIIQVVLHQNMYDKEKHARRVNPYKTLSFQAYLPAVVAAFKLSLNNASV